MHRDGQDWVLTGHGAEGRSRARGPTIVDRWADTFLKKTGRKAGDELLAELNAWMRALEA